MKFDKDSITLNQEEIRTVKNWHIEEYSSDGKDFILKRKIDSWLELYGEIKN